MSEHIRQQLRELTQGLPYRDLTAGVLRRHRRRQIRQRVVVAGVSAVVLAAGGLVVTAAPLATPGRDAAASPPPVTAPAPSPPTERAASPTTLTGTLYYYDYYQAATGLQERLWAWSVGERPRVLAEVGDPDDLGWGWPVTNTVAITADGARVAWVPRGGDPVVVDTASGDRRTVAAGDTDLGCLPPVWHPDGARLLVRRADGSAGWLDVASGQWVRIGADLSHACAATAFTTGSDTVTLAYEDLATRAVVAANEAGDELWRVDVIQLDERLAADGLWKLVDVADGGGYACIAIDPDVAGGAGGVEPAYSGSVVVDTATGAVVADTRPYLGLCTATTVAGYLSRVEEYEAEYADGASQQLRLTGYDGAVRAAIAEPPALYFTQLIGYAPATR